MTNIEMSEKLYNLAYGEMEIGDLYSQVGWHKEAREKYSEAKTLNKHAELQLKEVTL